MRIWDIIEAERENTRQSRTSEGQSRASEKFRAEARAEARALKAERRRKYGARSPLRGRAGRPAWPAGAGARSPRFSQRIEEAVFPWDVRF